MTSAASPKRSTIGTVRPRPAGIMRRATRFARYRLVTPLLRARHPAEYSARSVLVGVVCGLMPIIGQSTIVLAVWLIGRRFNWQFNVVIAALWTFISNPLTTPFMFYGFYVTGQVLMGNWNDLTGFDRFISLSRDLVSDQLGLWDQIKLISRLLFLDWALAMWVGFIPWGILCGWLGYRWSLKAIHAYRHVREKRIQRRRDELAAINALKA
jgi:uncharacterized protein (DUF2062 family)